MMLRKSYPTHHRSVTECMENVPTLSQRITGSVV